MSDRIVMRTGEALVEGDEDYLAAEPEVVIGELDGPVGQALATAYCAGPNIWTACFIPLIVTFVIRTVAGLAIRFGVRTASRLVCPADWFARAMAKA